MRRAESMSAAVSVLAQAGSSALPSLNTLHLDLLTLVFKMIALRPRLLVLARVCHRWRRVVRLGHCHLPPVAVPRLFRAVPQLTSVEFCAYDGVPSLWTPAERARLRAACFELPKGIVLMEAKLTPLLASIFASASLSSALPWTSSGPMQRRSLL